MRKNHVLNLLQSSGQCQNVAHRSRPPPFFKHVFFHCAQIISLTDKNSQHTFLSNFLLHSQFHLKSIYSIFVAFFYNIFLMGELSNPSLEFGDTLYSKRQNCMNSSRNPQKLTLTKPHAPTQSHNLVPYYRISKF